MTVTPINLLFILYIIMTPVYLFPSGMPQPGDFLVPIGVAVLFLTRKKIKFPSAVAKSFVLASLSFFVWVLIVSLGNALLSNLTDILNAAIFGIFNFMLILMGFAATQNNKRAHEMIAKALIGSTVIMFLGFLVNFTGTSRQTAMFNNPNQLAFFSILTLAGLIHVTDGSGLLRFRFVIPATMLIIANLAAASLTGYAAIGLLTCAWALKVGVRRLFVLCFVGLIAVLLMPFSFININSNSFFEIISNRFLIFDAKLDGGFIERGYDRIFDFPQYLLFGAGEGGLSRFGIEAALELHSTFGTILFSYGVVGLLLFLNIIRLACRGATLVELVLLAAPLAYSITHHGFRFSSFWIFLVILVMVRENRKMQRSTSLQHQLRLRSST